MRNKLLFLFLFSGFYLLAQKQLPLENLNNFKDQAGNWQIVSDVVMNRTIDIHAHQETETKTAKKRKKRKKKKNIVIPKAITFTEGTGVLLNNSQENKRDNLVTNWEHGDIYLEMDIMIPKGSNSGIYLQGRYELQLYDSWGVKQPKFSDIGGIYRNWENEPGKIFMGIAPLSNACKAPGLWQKLSLHFKAPRFNAEGKKTANAKFVFVNLNGQRIHNNIEIPLPTGGPISKQETAMGPIMIQGDHGAIAFRNIKYRLMNESKVTMLPISYKTYKGNYKSLENLDTAAILSEGTSKYIDVNLTGEEDAYGIVFNSNITIPEKEEYTFAIGYSGAAELIIDNKSIAKENYSDGNGYLKHTVELEKGNHTFILKNIKNAGWRAPRLSFTVTTPTTNPIDFHSLNSYPPNINSVSPIYVQPGATPRLLRGFLSFKKNEKRLSHTIGVGTPEGVNYAYDLKSGNMVAVWRGDFIDATPMWHSRGDGSFTPNGPVQWTFLNQPVAYLDNQQSPFPETGEAPEFISKGYSIESETGIPIFKQVYKGVEINNKIITDTSNTYLKNEITFSKTGLINWYYKLSSGKVKKMIDGSYAIGDNQYYIKLLSTQSPIIRETNGETELMIPVDGSTINYEIIW